MRSKLVAVIVFSFLLIGIAYAAIDFSQVFYDFFFQSQPQPTCIVGDKKCVGNDVYECDGTDYNTYIATCEYPQECIHYSDNYAYCDYQQTEKFYCYSNYDCQNNYGQGYVCDFSINECYYAGTAEAVCNSGDRKCIGSGVWECDYSGAYTIPVATCLENEQCVESDNYAYCESTQRSYAPESYCTSDPECEQQYGQGWLCDLETNQCYYAPKTEKESISQASTATQPTIYCSETYQCSTLYGKNWVCDYRKGKCVYSSECTSHDQCKKKYGEDWACNKNNNICFIIPICGDDSQCDDFGDEWVCNKKKYKCESIKQISKSFDIVFVPLNYEIEEDEEFQREALSQLQYFKQISPNTCLSSFSNIAFIEAGKCEEKCFSACCLNQVLGCAVRNGYAFSKRVVGIIKGSTELEKKFSGCAWQPGRVSTVAPQIASTDTLSHELGHNFGTCHVYGIRPLCGVPKDACDNSCPNAEDCKLNVFSRIKDVMSYCPFRGGYGPVAYQYITSLCNRLASGTPQQLVGVYATISKDGIVTLNSMHLGYDTLSEEEGNYLVSAFSDDGVLYQNDFNTQFSIHADVVGEDGKLYEEQLELDSVNTVAILPYSPEINRIEITDGFGRELLPDYSDELTEIVSQGKLFYEGSQGSKLIRVLADDAKLIAGVDEIKDIELTEEDGEPVYAVRGNKYFFVVPYEVEAVVSAEDGDLLAFNKPWWAFG